MSKLLMLFGLFLLLINCAPKKIKITQEISDEPVKFLFNRENRDRASITMTLPTEYKLNLKHGNMRYFSPIIIINNKLADQIKDYLIYNKKRKVIFGIEDIDRKKQIEIIVIYYKFFISKSEAQAILDKYNIKKSFDSIKFGDTISIAPYSQVRKDFPDIPKRLNKVPDSISFNFSLDPKIELYDRVRINW